jgi:hypothetical protein
MSLDEGRAGILHLSLGGLAHDPLDPTKNQRRLSGVLWHFTTRSRTGDLLVHHPNG